MPLIGRTVLVALLFAVALAGVPEVGGAVDSPALTAPDPQPEPLTAGEQYCRGQRVAIFAHNGTSENGTYAITRANNTTAVATLDFNESGRAIINTSVLSNGSYVLREGNETLVTNESGVVVGSGTVSNASFRVRECAFDARFENDDIEIETIGPKTTLHINTTLTETVYLKSSGIRDDILAGMFNGTMAADGARTAVPDNERIPVTATYAFICTAGPGDYTITITSADTGAVSQATLSAIVEADADAALGTISHNESRNMAQIPISINDDAICWDESDAVLRIGTNTSHFRVRTGINDLDENGQIVVRLNSSTAGTVPASEFLWAAGNDSLRNPTLVTDTKARPIPEGAYEVNLSAADRELDVGTLPIERNESFSPPSPTPMKTATATQTPGNSTPTTTAAIPETTQRATPSRTTDGDGSGFGVLTAVVAMALVACSRIALQSN